MKIGNHEIGTRKSVYVIAECGINHNGDIEIAKEMIRKASECGADAVKFQTIFPEELFSDKLNHDMFELSKTWSFSKKDHIELKKYAEKNNIQFFSTPVGKRSAKLLQEIDVRLIKIASGELTNHELIKMIAKMHKPVILSTGMSNISEIATAVEIIKKEKCPFVLLHCNAAYPTPIDDVIEHHINTTI